MDGVKIGKFIAQCRKNRNLTQMQLAEMLGITDRAVSKWENGKAMPDSAIMLELCGILGISVTDLLSGEVVTMEQHNKEAEKTLLELVKQKEAADKRLLQLEVVIGVLSTVIIVGFTCLASYVQMESWLRILVIAGGFALGLAGLGYAVWIEQTAGYYECAKCHHRYVPTFRSVMFSTHMGRTRYMKCPQCHEKSWQKKVIGKK